MLYLYLDESGDLGFDFFAKKPSKFFTITILSVQGVENNQALRGAVKKTIKRKLARNPHSELKGSNTSLEIKRYFYGLASAIPFSIYALTLNKKRVYGDITQRKDRVYNFIARKVLDLIPLDAVSTRISLVIDRSKGKQEIREFDDYIIRQLSGRIDPRIPVYIDHHLSHENPQIQAVDLFSWGIFRKYEKADFEWFNLFKNKVKHDSVFLP